MTAQEQQDEFHDIRDAVAKLCAQFPGEYWRKLDRQMAYPKDARHRAAAGAHSRVSRALFGGNCQIFEGGRQAANKSG